MGARQPHRESEKPCEGRNGLGGAEKKTPESKRQKTPLFVENIFKALDLDGKGEINFHSERLVCLLRKIEWPKELESMSEQVKSILDVVEKEKEKRSSELKDGANTAASPRADLERLKKWFRMQPITPSEATRLIFAIGKAKKSLEEEELKTVEGILRRSQLHSEYNKAFIDAKVTREELLAISTKEKEKELIKRTGLKPGHMVKLRRVIKFARTIRKRQCVTGEFEQLPVHQNCGVYFLGQIMNKVVFGSGGCHERHHKLVQERYPINQWDSGSGLVFREFKVSNFHTMFGVVPERGRSRRPYFAIGVTPVVSTKFLAHNLTGLHCRDSGTFGSSLFKVPRETDKPFHYSIAVSFSNARHGRRGHSSSSSSPKGGGDEYSQDMWRVVGFSLGKRMWKKRAVEAKASGENHSVVGLLIDLRTYRMHVFLDGTKVVDGKQLGALPGGVGSYRATVFARTKKGSNLTVEILPTTLSIPEYAKAAVSPSSSLGIVAYRPLFIYGSLAGFVLANAAMLHGGPKLALWRNMALGVSFISTNLWLYTRKENPLSFAQLRLIIGGAALLFWPWIVKDVSSVFLNTAAQAKETMHAQLPLVAGIKEWATFLGVSLINHLWRSLPWVGCIYAAARCVLRYIISPHQVHGNEKLESFCGLRDTGSERVFWRIICGVSVAISVLTEYRFRRLDIATPGFKLLLFTAPKELIRGILLAGGYSFFVILVAAYIMDENSQIAKMESLEISIGALVFNLYVASCHQDYDFYYKQTLISTWAHTFKYGFGILGLLKMARLSYLKYTINKNAELRDIMKSLACTIFIPIGVSAAFKAFGITTPFASNIWSQISKS